MDGQKTLPEKIVLVEVPDRRYPGLFLADVVIERRFAQVHRHGQMETVGEQPSVPHALGRKDPGIGRRQPDAHAGTRLVQEVHQFLDVGELGVVWLEQPGFVAPPSLWVLLVGDPATIDGSHADVLESRNCGVVKFGIRVRVAVFDHGRDAGAQQLGGGRRRRGIALLGRGGDIGLADWQQPVAQRRPVGDTPQQGLEQVSVSVHEPGEREVVLGGQGPRPSLRGPTGGRDPCDGARSQKDVRGRAHCEPSQRRGPLTRSSSSSPSVWTKDFGPPVKTATANWAR